MKMIVQGAIAFAILISIPQLFRHYHECLNAQFTSRTLYNSPQCSDVALRIRYGPLQESVCRKAQDDLRIHPGLCALEMWWETVRFVCSEHYWVLLAIAIVVMWIAARSAVQIYNGHLNRKMFAELMMYDNRQLVKHRF